MRRTNIYLSDDQCDRLDVLAGRQGTSRAAVIRRLIDDGLDAHAPSVAEDLAVIDAAFGSCADLEFPNRAPDGRAEHLAHTAATARR